jgi:hypothetical protein
MATNEELQQQLDALREEVRRLHGQPGAPDGAGTLSRRALLRAAPVAAVGGVVATLVSQPAAAATGDPVLLGRTNNAGNGATTTLNGGTPGSGVAPGATPSVRVGGGLAGDWLAVAGVTAGVGTDAQLQVAGDLRRAGLAAQFLGGAASGTTNAQAGGDCVRVQVLGPGTGVIVDAVDGSVPIFGAGGSTPLPATGIASIAELGTAVQASATSGAGIATTCSGDGHALTADSTSTSANRDAVTIDYAGKGRALYAQSHNPTNINGTVTGVNEGHGIGVWGEQRNSTGPGIGVVGVGGRLGRGAQLTGGAAQARLVPSAAATHPSTGKAGDLFVDASIRLWFCQRASSGSVAAAWKQLA